MLTGTPQDDFEKTHRQVIQGIRNCLDARLIPPALMLIYSEIDVFAWIAAGKAERNVRTRFESWVRNWMLSKHSLSCSPTDLYAARCGILHSLSFDADLTRGGHARQVWYVWGNRDVNELQIAVDRLGKTDCVAVHVNDLFAALCDGIAAFLAIADTNPKIRQRIEEAARSQISWV